MVLFKEQCAKGGKVLTADFILGWAEKYEKEQGENESVTFTEGGRKRIEQDMRHFTSLRKAIFDKGFLERADLAGICEFKSGSRNLGSLQENSGDEIKKLTEHVVENLYTDETPSLSEKLVELKGVGVKTASAILTVLAPDQYTILDYRAARTLIWTTIKQENYREFYRAMEVFREPSADDYGWYNRKIKSIARETDTTPREVDMALWKFDKEVGDE